MSHLWRRLFGLLRFPRLFDQYDPVSGWRFLTEYDRDVHCFNVTVYTRLAGAMLPY